MDEEQQQQAGPPDVNTGDFDQIIAAAERGEYDQPATGGERSDTLAAATEVDSEPQGAPTSQPEVAAAPPAQQEPDENTVEYWKRRADSYGGNLATAARERQAALQQAQEYQRQLQAQQAEFQRQTQLAQQEAQIRASLPGDEADEAVREFRQRTQAEQAKQEFQTGAEAYRQYLAQETAKLENLKVENFRSSIPSVMPDLARHIASQFQAPDEGLVEMVQSEQFREALAMVGQPTPRGVHQAQRDLDLIAAVLAGAAGVEAKRDAGRKQSNAQRAVQSGQFRTEPETSRAMGLPEIERIKAMDPSGPEFDKMVAGLVAQSGR